MSRTPTPLTARQLEALQAIERFMAQHKRPPQIRELCAELSISSTNAAAGIIDALEIKGWVTYERTAGGFRRSSSIRILFPSSATSPPVADDPTAPPGVRSPSLRGYGLVDGLLCIAALFVAFLCGLELAAAERARDSWRNVALTCFVVVEDCVDGLEDCVDLLEAAAHRDDACSCWIPPPTP